MADVTVTPTTWEYVRFDAERIAAIASKLLDEIGLDVALGIEVDETTPLATARVASLDPLVITAESGAFEDPKRPRQLSERATADVLGRLLFRSRDRLDPAFADAPSDEDLTMAQSVAWDVYAVGRQARLGYPVSRQRRLYHFRNRHGFSDTADATFQQLWSGSDLAWTDVVAACDATQATRTPVG